MTVTSLAAAIAEAKQHKRWHKEGKKKMTMMTRMIMMMMTTTLTTTGTETQRRRRIMMIITLICSSISSSSSSRRWCWWFWQRDNNDEEVEAEAEDNNKDGCCRDKRLIQIHTRNKIEVIIYIEGTKQDKDDKRQGEGKEVTHSFCKKETYILSCCTQLGTVHTLYPWIGTSSNTIQERRQIFIGIIIICMVPIRLYIIHCTQHTILIATSSQMDNHEWLLHCYPCTKSSLPTWNYFIAQSIASPNCIHHSRTQ